MRYLVYFVAVMVAAAIVYYVGLNENQPVAASAQTGQVQTGDVQTGDVQTGDVQTVSLKVPGMHCPMACYPSVKKALQGESGVQGVDLVDQKEEGVIDNPVVIIQHDEAFDLDQAVASLEKLGFAGAAVATE